MNAPGSHQAAALKLIRAMAAEAEELKKAAGNSVTDTVAAWLAPQYLLAANEKLTTTASADRLAVLRTFLHDWALLRRGDHAAARLQLDSESSTGSGPAASRRRRRIFGNGSNAPRFAPSCFQNSPVASVRKP